MDIVLIELFEPTFVWLIYQLCLCLNSSSLAGSRYAEKLLFNNELHVTSTYRKRKTVCLNELFDLRILFASTVNQLPCFTLSKIKVLSVVFGENSQQYLKSYSVDIRNRYDCTTYSTILQQRERLRKPNMVSTLEMETKFIEN